MVYWARFLYRYPQHTDELYSFDKLYNSEPYVKAKEGALQEYNDTYLDKIKSKVLDKVGDYLDDLQANSGFDVIGKYVVKKLLKDLDFYYDSSRLLSDSNGKPEVAATLLKNNLKEVLKKHEGKEIEFG